MLRSLYVAGMLVLLVAWFQGVTACGKRSHGAPDGAAQVQPSAGLDSRTIPHPDWVQVSGHIEETRTVTPQGQQPQLLALLQPVEGGQVIVDLGPADRLGSVMLQNRDYLHVRGTPAQSGQHRIIFAGEIIADGKVIAIERPANSVGAPQANLSEQPQSPAAPRAPAAP